MRIARPLGWVEPARRTRAALGHAGSRSSYPKASREKHRMRRGHQEPGRSVGWRRRLLRKRLALTRPMAPGASTAIGFRAARTDGPPRSRSTAHPALSADFLRGEP
jgi:hypothetical protein